MASPDLLLDAALLGGAIGLGVEIGLILATFAIDFNARLRDGLTRRQLVFDAWLRDYPHYVRRKFSPDIVPMLKATVAFVVVPAVAAVALVLMAIGALEVIG